MQKDDEPQKRGDADAKQWASRLASHFGDAVHFHRNRLGLSAVQLSARTKEIGYPITRGAIAKIEGNYRNGKMDVAEVLTLAAALEVSPIDLVFPFYPSFGTDALPKFSATAHEVHAWFSADENYEPFGKVNYPRNETSRALRQLGERTLNAIGEMERKLSFTPRGFIDPSSLSRDEAFAIWTDLLNAKLEMRNLGGSFAGVHWDWQLKDLLDDPNTEWRPF